jgi:hypothetical protein
MRDAPRCSGVAVEDVTFLDLAIAALVFRCNNWTCWMKLDVENANCLATYLDK